MKRTLGLVLVLAIVGVALFVAVPWSSLLGRFGSLPGSPDGGSAGGAAVPAPNGVSRHVLLITVDTLRADRVGVYGWANARTPTLDALGRRGMRFTRAYAAAPITLTSHATLLTGREPPGHGARHNGVAMRATVPTLATRFREAGFQTAAFVSAFPLDRRFGLARDFDLYDDELPRGDEGRPRNERPGSVTADRAIAWIRAHRASARLFAWVHLFEPHAPYGTPSAGGPRRGASERYDDDVAAADREIGRLLDAWHDIENTLVVATADHGEAFGEHDEVGHSIFVYDATLQVPLIVAGPEVASGTSDAVVGLVDLAATIASRSGIPPLDSDGVNLSPALRGEPLPGGARALYAESFAPLLDFGWAPLRSLRREELKFIAAPRAELYDVAADPREEHNVVDTRADAARELAQRVEGISPADLLPSAAPAADLEALARLRALGYAGSGAPTPVAGERPDPKDRIRIASRLAAVTSGELEDAAVENALRDVLEEDPGNTQAHLRLGYVLAESGRCADAEAHFAAAIARRLPSADAHLGLALCQVGRGAAAAALSTLREGRGVEPGNPVVEANIGLLELEAGRAGAAIPALRGALAIDPHLHQARFALARALARTGNRQAALGEATELLDLLPPDAPQRPEVERLISALR